MQIILKDPLYNISIELNYTYQNKYPYTIHFLIPNYIDLPQRYILMKLISNKRSLIHLLH